jgi:hypothetical protein
LVVHAACTLTLLKSQKPMFGAGSHTLICADIHLDVGFRRSKLRSVDCEMSEGVVFFPGTL